MPIHHLSCGPAPSAIFYRRDMQKEARERVCLCLLIETARL
jgi:hypothetical protein